MIYLKRIFPNNLYSTKGITVKTIPGKKEYILNSSSILSIPPTNKLNLKIDYHKADVEIFGSKLDAYYIVNLKPVKNNILFFLKVLFKNSLEVRKVTEDEFNNYSAQMIYDNQIPFELNKQNTAYIFIAFVISLFFVLFPLNTDHLTTEISTMSFWFGALSFMGFVSLFFLRKISVKQFYIRLTAFGIASIVLGGYLIMV